MPPAVIASGPLTSPALAEALEALTGQAKLSFYDAVAPIVAAESVDMSIAFRASRYGQGQADYVNCPMEVQEYQAFVEALVAAERIPLRGFELEDARFFEACLPVEVLASRGERSLAFGPLRPTGLVDPRTGGRPFAVVQLRHEDMPGSAYNLVGFQTNLRYGEQRRVFRMIPGLQCAEFLRLGQMHRNTFVRSPVLLEPSLQLRGHAGIFLAGQLTGTEGYAGSAASGWVAGLNVARHVLGRQPAVVPQDTMIGALCHYVSQAAPETFQPMKANFGLLPPALGPTRRSKRDRRAAMVERAIDTISRFATEHGADADVSRDIAAEVSWERVADSS
jgi:methylenetetrahydrofolate--tRNA-(uracil-5-)-methyltransferase